MAWSFGIPVVFLLCLVAGIEGVTTQDCTLSEFITGAASTMYQVDRTETLTFTRVDSVTVVTERRMNGAITESSQIENCKVLIKNGIATEVIIAFKLLNVNTGQRYCFKGVLRNWVLFFVAGPKSVRDSLSTELCLSELSATSFYQMMIKMPIPSTAADFKVDIGSIIPSNTYKITYQEDNQAEQCTPSTKLQSFITVSTNYVRFDPCGATATSYKFPFRKDLYIAGYVSDDMLRIVNSNSQSRGGFMVAVYSESSGADFKYYLMRYYEATFSDANTDTYFVFNFMTTESLAYGPNGYVDTIYVPTNLVADVMIIKMSSEECKTLPCLNNGVCVNRWLNYTCNCPTGFDGDRCDGKTTECAKNTIPGSLCSFHGNCEDINGGYKCVCNSGYTGPKCSVQTNCFSGTCKNGGTCVDIGFAFCLCPPGKTGKFCDQSPICASQQPCKNGGVCYDVPGASYFCDCPANFFGQNCDGDVPLPPVTGPAICLPSVTDELCQNGGVCIDFKCECQGYFVGKYCQDMNRWFIASIVMIVLLAVILIVTLIVCCFFCARGRALGTSTEGSTSKKPYDPFASPFQQPAPQNMNFAPGSVDFAPSNAGFGPVGYGQPAVSDGGFMVQAY